MAGDTVFVTLDTFFVNDGTVPLEIVYLAAQLGTAHTNNPDSVWAGEAYGSTVEELLLRPNGGVAVQREIERVVAATGLTGTVTVVDNIATIETLNATITLSREGITVGV